MFVLFFLTPIPFTSGYMSYISFLQLPMYPMFVHELSIPKNTHTHTHKRLSQCGW